MCDKAVDNYLNALEFILDYYKTHKICNKTVSIYPSIMQCIFECYNTQECVMKLVMGNFCI